MAEVTYYVALPFIMIHDGPAPGEAAECTSANAAIMLAESLARKEGTVGAVALQPNRRPRDRRIQWRRFIASLWRRAQRSKRPLDRSVQSQIAADSIVPDCQQNPLRLNDAPSILLRY